MKAQKLIDDCDELFEREDFVREISKQELVDKNITKILNKTGGNQNGKS